MGIKKQKLQDQAEAALLNGVLSILQDSSREDQLRLRTASNVLHNVSCPLDVYRETLSWLLRRCHGDSQCQEPAAAVVAECLSSPGVLVLLDENADLLPTLLSAAVSGSGARHRQLSLTGLSADTLIAAVASTADGVTASPDDQKAFVVLERLFGVLSGPDVSRLGTGSQRREAYLRHLLVPSLRVSASHPQLTAASAAVFGTLILSDGDLAGCLLTLAASMDPPPLDDQQETKPLLSALYNLSAADPAVGAQLMAVLGSALLRGQQLVLAVALLASRAGFQPPVSLAVEEQVALLAVPRLEPETPPLPPDTRLMLLTKLMTCVSDLRLSLTASYKQVTLLQWLRALAALLLSPQWQLQRSAAWFDCLAQLLRVSPLVLPLNSRLGPLLLVALETAAGHTPTSAAAVRLVQLVVATYGDLHQLPRLLPQLLLSARSNGQPLLFGSCELKLLAEKLSRVPHAHVPQLWKTLLYHMKEDVLKCLEVGSETAAAGLTLQLSACFLGNAAVVDQTTTPASTRKLLASHMAETCSVISQIGGMVDSRTSSASVEGLLSVSVCWRQLHTVLGLYCEEYRTANTSSDPYSPLSCQLWQKFTQLPGASEGRLARLLQNMKTEIHRTDLLPPDTTIELCSDLVSPANRAELERRLSEDADDWRLHIDVIAALASAVGDAGAQGTPLTKLARSIMSGATSRDPDVGDVETGQVSGTVLSALSHVGVLLQSRESLKVSASSATSVTTALKLLEQIPLENLWTTWGSRLLALLGLCLMMEVEDEDNIKQGRKRCQSGGEVPPKKKSKKSRSSAVNTENDVLSAQVMTEELNPRYLALLTLPALLYSFRQQAAGLDALRQLQPCRLLSWLRHTQVASHLNSDVTQAVLTVFSGDISIEVSDYADALIAEVDEGKFPLSDARLLVELLRHYVAAKDDPKCSNADIKRQAKCLASCLPRLLSGQESLLPTLPPMQAAWLFAGWSLLVRLRAHKPSSGPTRSLWRLQLGQLYPLAIQSLSQGTALIKSDESVSVHPGGEASMLSSDEFDGAVAEGCSEAWTLLRTVCSHRHQLVADVPETVVEELWRCARSAAVPPSQDTAVVLLTSADDSQLEMMLVDLEKDTAKLTVDTTGDWRRPLLLWRALAEAVFPEEDTSRRHRQRQGLQWVLSHLGHVLARQQEPLVSSHIHLQILPTLITISAIVKQKTVRISDVSVCASLLACRPHFCSSVPSDQVALVLQNVAMLLEKLCDSSRSFVVNRVPLLTQAIAYVFQQTCARSLFSPPGHQAALLSACNAAGRAVRQLCKLGSPVEPTAPQLAADLLQMASAGEAPLPANVQEVVTRTVYALLALCRDETLTRLRVTVPAAVRPMLHSAITGYKRYYKFAGRV